MSHRGGGDLSSRTRKIASVAACLGVSVLLVVAQGVRAEDAVFIGPIPPEYETSFDVYKPKYTGEVRRLDGRTGTIMLNDPRVEGVGRDVPTLWDPEARCQTTLTEPELISRTPRRYRLRVRHGVKRKESMCRRFDSLAPSSGSVYVTLSHGAGGAVEYDVELAIPNPNLDLTGTGFGTGDAGETVWARGKLHTGETLARFPHASWFDEPRFRNEARLARYPAFMEGEITDRHGVRRAFSLHRILFRGKKIATIGIYDGHSGCLYLSDSRIRKEKLRGTFDISPKHYKPSSALSLECDEDRSIRVPSGIPDPTSFSLMGNLELEPSGVGDWQAALRWPPYSNRAGTMGVGRLRQVEGQPMVVDYTPANGLRSVAGHHLVNNYGIFRLVAKTGTAVAIYLVEGTDALGPFSAGDAVGSGYWNPERQTLAASFLSRAAPGLCETEGPNLIREYQPKFVAGTGAAGRYWIGGRRAGEDVTRVCVSEYLDEKTCKRTECLRWNDEVPFFDETWLLVQDEGLAKRLYAAVPKWTNASLRLPTAGRRTRTQGRSPSYYSPGSCGIESCYDQRMREVRDEYIQSLL